MSQSAASISVAMSASLKETPWNRPMGCPNCRRLAAQSTQRSRQRRARPTHMAATVRRVAPSQVFASSNPAPSSPSICEAGARQSSKTRIELW